MHRSPRNTALFALVALALMLVAAVLLESGQRRIIDALGDVGPMIGLAALPLLYMVVRLSAGPARGPLIVGVGYSAIVLGAFALDTYQKCNGDSDAQREAFFRVVFFWYRASWAIFLVLYLPALGRLLLVSRRALREVPRGRGDWLPLGALAAIALTVFSVMPRGVARADGMEQYRDSEALHKVDKFYECLWTLAGPAAEAGFPDSLGAIRSVTQEFNGKPRTFCGDDLDYALKSQPFDVAYEATSRDASGRARGFRLSTTERVRAGGRPSVFMVDETGVLRQARRTERGELDSVRVVNSFNLVKALRAEHLIEAYAAARADGAYPRRLAHEALAPADTADVLLYDDFGPCSRDDAHPVVSCLDWKARRALYLPRRDATGRVASYDLIVPSQLTESHGYHDPGSDFRSYYRDSAGTWHAFGGGRDATEEDPVVDPEELARVRADVARWVEGKRVEEERRVRRERWRDSLVRDSLARDSLARDSARRDSTAPETR